MNTKDYVVPQFFGPWFGIFPPPNPWPQIPALGDDPVTVFETADIKYEPTKPAKICKRCNGTGVHKKRKRRND